MFTLTIVLFLSSVIYFLFSIYKIKLLKKKIDKFKINPKELTKHTDDNSQKFNGINIINKIIGAIIIVTIVLTIIYRENEISLFSMSIGLFSVSGFLFLSKELSKKLYYIYSSNKHNELLDDVYIHQQSSYKHCILSILLLSIATFMAYFYI